MANDAFKIIKLETHPTKDTKDKHINGTLTVIWRDWDGILSSHPKMIYITSANPGEVKGPHLHTKRDSYFVCIRGKVVLVVKDMEKKYHEIELSEENLTLVQIPKNYASAHINITDNISSVLTLASIAWKPNDNEMKDVYFDDYDWNKWKKK